MHERLMPVDHQWECPTCHGEGELRDHWGDVEQCEDCNGSGGVKETVWLDIDAAIEAGYGRDR